MEAKFLRNMIKYHEYATFSAGVNMERHERKRKEREKALVKYGQEALAPGGRAEFDILDFLISEVVGLDRYGEMVVNRFHRQHIIDVGHALRETSEIFAPILIEVRQELITEGQHLGIVEANRFQLPDQKA